MIQYKFTEQAKQLAHERGLDFTPILADAGSSGYDLRACIPTEKTLLYVMELITFRIVRFRNVRGIKELGSWAVSGERVEW